MVDIRKDRLILRLLLHSSSGPHSESLELRRGDEQIRSDCPEISHEGCALLDKMHNLEDVILCIDMCLEVSFGGSGIHYLESVGLEYRDEKGCKPSKKTNKGISGWRPVTRDC